MKVTHKNKKVCVIGLGYIGLPTAVVLASTGYRVIGVDVNPAIVEAVNSGNAHIAETDLDMLVHASVTSGSLVASSVPEEADIFIVAVPTPLNADKSPDISSVESAFDSIASHVKQGDLLIIESTCPVATTEAVVDRLYNLRPDLIQKIYVAYCPERVLPGQILRELVDNDRVIGGISTESTEKAVEFYKSFVKGKCMPTNVRTAEMCKLTENAFRDVNIAFANELSIICDEQGIDVWQLIKLANQHPRVNVLQPGPGVGGHCIPIDPWFIISKDPNATPLLRAARAVNDGKTSWVIKQIEAALSKIQSTKNTTVSIACLGITFKANVDDIRESPALDVTLRLAKKYSSQLLVVEPNLENLPEVLVKKSVQMTSIDYVSNIADLVIVLVDHEEFKSCVFNRNKPQIILDFKGLWAR